jgi:hypothetical protein
MLGVVLATRLGEPGVESRLLGALIAEPVTRRLRLQPLSIEWVARVRAGCAGHGRR